MRYKTTKLKRFKIINTLVLILTLPIRLPLIVLIAIGEIIEKSSTKLLDFIDDNILCNIMEFIIKKFKFDDVADKQYEVNKDKFKLK